jgi:hypothetical protein
MLFVYGTHTKKSITMLIASAKRVRLSIVKLLRYLHLHFILQ